jgi:VPDSG-CTERM motif
MKVNRISTKKLAILSAGFCAVMLAFNPNAKAVTVLNFNDGHTLGRVFSGEGPVAQRTALVNHMIGMALSTSDRFSGHVVFRDGNNFGPLPGPAVFALTGHGTNITIGSGLYSYLLAQYGTGIDSVGHAWYIGNLSGDITIPAATGIMRLTRWKLFGPGVPGVPDGGTTVMLLGAALVALGMARQFLKI